MPSPWTETDEATVGIRYGVEYTMTLALLYHKEGVSAFTSEESVIIIAL